MLKRMSVLLVIVLVVGMLIPTAQISAHENCGFLSLVDGWARASAEGAPNSAAYGWVVNMTGEDDALIGGSTEAAEAVEIHEMIMGAGDVMQMRPVEGGLAVPNNTYATLQPGGYHIMLINLTHPLVAGEMLELTLTFQHAGDVTVMIPIHDAAEMEMGGGMGDMATEQPMGGMDMATEEPMHMDGEHEHGVDSPENCHHVFLVNGWVRPANASQPNSAAYGLLLNLTDEEVTVTGGSAAFAGAVEMHEMIMGAGDVMQMRPIEGGLVVPAGHAVELKPGSFHIMLIGLTSELAAGSTADLTLNLSDGSTLELTLPIQEPPMEGEMGGMSMGG